MRQFSWTRVVTTGILSALIVPVLWGLTAFGTAGVYIARLAVPVGSEWVSSLVFETAAAMDFALSFMALWGVRGLWVQFKDEVRKRGTAKWRPSHLGQTAVPLNAVLCALLPSFYVVLGTAVLFNNGRLPHSMPLFVGGILVSLLACTAAIVGLFTVAVRFWPASWVPIDSDTSKFTTLNLR